MAKRSMVPKESYLSPWMYAHCPSFIFANGKPVLNLLQYWLSDAWAETSKAADKKNILIGYTSALKMLKI